MSSLTSLYGGGGGGGETHIVTDPKKLPRYALQDVVLKPSAPSQTESNSTGFFSSMNNRVNTATVEGGFSADTYTTLLDIPSAPNGGYLHWVLSQKVNNLDNSKVTVKITVDGSAVEFAYEYNETYTNGRMFIGGGIYAGDANTSSTTATTGRQRFNNYYNDYFSNEGRWRQDSTNNVPYSGTNATSGQYTQIESSMPDLMTLPYHRLYFESSLKIEVKQLTIASNFAGRYAACMYTLI